jgi:hypothetical protein
MTIGEAIAVNTLIDLLLDDEEAEPTTVQKALEAGALLSRKAKKVLFAGVTEADWRRRWKKKVSP